MRIRVLYLAAGGSLTLVRAELARLARDVERYYPNCETSVVLGEMPFEDEVSSFGSYFDKKTFSVKNETEKRKCVYLSPPRSSCFMEGAIGIRLVLHLQKRSRHHRYLQDYVFQF